MEDLFSWFLAILALLGFFVPKIIGILLFIIFVSSAIWAVSDATVFTAYGGVFNRGIKVSTRLLTNDERKFLESLSENIIVCEDNRVGGDVSAFIVRQNSEVLIHAREWYRFRRRRLWPVLGYVNLSEATPALEFKVSTPFVLFLICLACSIVLLPAVFGLWLIGFNMEKDTIEKFLKSKVQISLNKREES